MVWLEQDGIARAEEVGDGQGNWPPQHKMNSLPPTGRSPIESQSPRGEPQFLLQAPPSLPNSTPEYTPDGNGRV